MKSDSNLTKWEIVYEDEQTISVWKYNSAITKNGPVQVEVKYKAGYKPPITQKKKTLGDLAKEARKEGKSKDSKS
jgi:hypothetical protein